VFDALGPLTPEDLAKTVTVRGEPHTVVEAINRQLTHYSYHVGQIVFLAKHLKSSEWRTLSIPRNSSQQFNQFLAGKQAAGQVRASTTESAAESAAEFAATSEKENGPK